MALTIANLKRDVSSKRVHYGTIAFDSSYPAGGESLTAADVSLHTIERIEFEPALGFTFAYDYTNKKVKAFCPGVVTTAAGAGVLDDFPLSGVGATAVSVGMTAGNTTTRFGGQVEVADTVDLSTVTTRYVATGT
jgi:hypothetical protein